KTGGGCFYFGRRFSTSKTQARRGSSVTRQRLYGVGLAVRAFSGAANGCSARRLFVIDWSTSELEATCGFSVNWRLLYRFFRARGVGRFRVQGLEGIPLESAISQSDTSSDRNRESGR